MGTMAAALWDVLAKAANLAQLSGLHAVMLVAAGATLLGIPQSKRECAELERCARRLQAILRWPATASCGVALLCSDVGVPLTSALVEAAGLVDSYRKSTLWWRVRRGRSMARQLRDMQDVLNSYCGLVLFLNAHLLLLQATTTHPTSTSSDATTINEVNDPSQSPGVQALTTCPTEGGAPDTQRANHTGGQGEKTGSQTGSIDPAGCEGIVPAIVISHA